MAVLSLSFGSQASNSIEPQHFFVPVSPIIIFGIVSLNLCADSSLIQIFDWLYDIVVISVDNNVSFYDIAWVSHSLLEVKFIISGDTLRAIVDTINALGLPVGVTIASSNRNSLKFTDILGLPNCELDFIFELRAVIIALICVERESAGHC